MTNSENDEIESPPDFDESEITPDMREKILGSLGSKVKGLKGHDDKDCNYCDEKDECDDPEGDLPMKYIGLMLAASALENLPVNRISGRITVVSHDNEKREITITIKARWGPEGNYGEARDAIGDRIRDYALLVL